MARRVLFGVLLLLVLVAIGVWYAGRPSADEASLQAPARAGEVEPNAALADIFTQLEKEWAETAGAGIGGRRNAVGLTGQETKPKEEKR